MNRLQSIFIITCFMTGLFSVNAHAKWSLLEDYQLRDIAGDEGLCLGPRKTACDFGVLEYMQTYPDDELKDDMDESMTANLEMIFSEYFLFHPYVPYPAPEPAFVTPTPGDPFFQSDWFSPGFPPDLFPGWDSLYENLQQTLSSRQYQ